MSGMAWTNVEMGPPDGILGLVEAFNKDTAPKKVNLSVGAYRDNENKPFVLPSVRTAEERVLAAKMNKEYAPIVGVDDFVKKARAFALGPDSPALAEGRIASVQSLSGTGACRVIGEFYSKFLGPGPVNFYLPTPSWGNRTLSTLFFLFCLPLTHTSHSAHTDANIFKNAGLDVKSYTYLDKAGVGFDCDGMLADLKAMPPNSALLLHACAHNPTGVDPTHEQWRQICATLKARPDLAIFFDSAYQGFASGDAEKDAYAMRLFVSEGVPFALAQSFAKNFGLYGERVGVLSMVCNEAEEASRVLSQLKIVVRAMYSNPPVHGARIVAEVLGDPTLEAQWRAEGKQMADRIIEMREALQSAIVKAGSTKDWGHITSQIGMFCYSGLKPDQVDKLRADYNIYITKDGRISMAGITTSNVDYVAGAMHEVSK